MVTKDTAKETAGTNVSAATNEAIEKEKCPSLDATVSAAITIDNMQALDDKTAHYPQEDIRRAWSAWYSLAAAITNVYLLALDDEAAQDPLEGFRKAWSAWKRHVMTEAN